MAGIVSYGAYVPPTRLPFAVIGGRAAREGGPERAVAWNDEDAVTMAVAAAVECLRGFERDAVDGVLFASTTMPFNDRQNAGIMATALNLSPNLMTMDISSSQRAGTSALINALRVAEGKSGQILFSASEHRRSKVSTTNEMLYGDGAVAFMLGDEVPQGGTGVPAVGVDAAVWEGLHIYTHAHINTYTHTHTRVRFC